MESLLLDTYHRDKAVAARRVLSPEAKTVALLERLLAQSSRGDAPPPLPVRAHTARLSSGARGLSVGALRGVRTFYAAHGGLEKQMDAVCKEECFAASVCALTRRSGLSLAETLVLESAAADDGAADLVGEASSFFSYSWTGTGLGEMLGAIERLIGELEAAGSGGERYVWVDMFAASQV